MARLNESIVVVCLVVLVSCVRVLTVYLAIRRIESLERFQT